MRRVVLALIGLWLFASVASAAPAPFHDNAPDQYTVKKGDTLWDISALFLKKPWLWPEIWQANPQIQNPHLIYPGDSISLIYVDGQPRLTLSRGREVKLAPKARVIEHADAIPTLPLEMISNYLSLNRVVDSAELEAAPYVVAGHEKRLMSSIGDDFYARGDFSGSEQALGVFRRGDAYVDPATKEVLGIRAMDVGAAQIKALDGAIATLTATRTSQEILSGDRLLPGEARRVDSLFYPSAPAGDIHGVILLVEGGVSNGGHLDVVAINRGERDGLVAGNTLAIYKLGEVVQDRIAKDTVTLPPDRAGLLMVFRTFEKMSFGLVLHADRPIAVNDLVQNP
ncbi:MAG: LysM peptidoglycan-binding domain-containing protein [Porticoccaceae bacterium]